MNLRSDSNLIEIESSESKLPRANYRENAILYKMKLSVHIRVGYQKLI